eukprot:TRINITY_DN17255_c0_g1_i2.p1 TRINITY_DN17255_c0_g1~~TRINITY_DN17255_c0_g1_i2.p1  ORF type:complete len:166 (-),score=15.89 TRINITY_DN17255_c0_g1_i2:670-1167(-)
MGHGQCLWYTTKNRILCLVTEDQRVEQLFDHAMTVSADDVARAGVSFNAPDLIDQLVFWDQRLDHYLGMINLAQNHAKKHIVVSTADPEIVRQINRMRDCPDSPFRQLENELTYLGCTISATGNIDSEIKSRITQARCAWGSMKKFWNQHTIKESLRRTTCIKHL